MITIKINNNADMLISRLKESVIKDYDGEFSGDSNFGRLKVDIPFAGIFQGVYSIQGKLLELSFEKKPSLISESMCEYYIKNYLESFDY